MRSSGNNEAGFLGTLTLLVTLYQFAAAVDALAWLDGVSTLPDSGMNPATIGSSVHA